MTQITFKSAGIQEMIASVRRIPADSRTIGAQAINKTIVSSRAEASRDIRSQVNFPASYLGSPNDPRARLSISKKATKDDLEAVISARKRPTSLARFTVADANGRNVRVQVKPSVASVALRGAFIVRLRSGAAIGEDNFNLGLAIRLKKGDPLRNSRAALQVSPGLFLLYGPSVDQVFQTVREDIAPQAMTNLKNEYYRLLQLRNK